MKESLFNKYCKLCKSYYQIDINAASRFSGDKYEADNCYQFIEQHFTSASKYQALCTPWRGENGGYRKLGKHTHTVSLYLLALLLEKDSAGLIESPLKNLIYSYSSWGNYKYTWFLTCLYHDVAAHFEKATQFSNAPESSKELLSYLKQQNIQHTIYNHIPLNNSACGPRFSQELLCGYFHYQATIDKPECDHGIVGGYFLFDSLYKNFLAETKGFSFTRDNFKLHNGLQWRLAHLDHFAYISDAIICHNLWTANTWNPNNPEYKTQEDRAKVYQQNGLVPLIIEKGEQRVSFQKYPVQFMLYLLDSIEPVKQFAKKPEDCTGVSAKTVLEHISINYYPSQGEHTIKIFWDNVFEDFTGFNNWCNKLKELEYWMAVKIQQEAHGFLISFPKWTPPRKGL